MGYFSDLTDGVQDTRTRFMVRGIDQSDVRIVGKRLFDYRQVGKFVNGKLQIDMGKTVIFADFHRTGAVGTVIDNQNFLIRRKKRVQADIDIDRTRAAKQDGRMFGEVSMRNADQVVT